MSEHASDATNDGDRTPKPATPRSALEELRNDQVDQESELRAAVQEAMLLACGELGYRDVTVRDVLERSACSRVRFYRLFSSKADCYTKSYEVEAGRLCDALLRAAAAETSWRAGLGAALRDLALFVTLRPVFAKGLLVEVHVAGEPTLMKRTAMMERLSHAIDNARRENDSRHSPPPITAEFMVCAIEESVVMALVKDEPQRFAEAVPELAHLTVAPFFGEKAAREDMAALRAGLRTS